MNFMKNMFAYDERKKRQIDQAIDRRDFKELTKLTIGE